MEEIHNQKEINEFDFLNIVYNRLKRSFPAQFNIGGNIPNSRYFQIMSWWFRFNKNESKTVLHALISRYNCFSRYKRGIKIEPNGEKNGKH